MSSDTQNRPLCYAEPSMWYAPILAAWHNSGRYFPRKLIYVNRWNFVETRMHKLAPVENPVENVKNSREIGSFSVFHVFLLRRCSAALPYMQPRCAHNTSLFVDRIMSTALQNGKPPGPKLQGLSGIVCADGRVPSLHVCYPSMRMVRFSGSLGAAFLGTLSFRTPSSKRALISSSVRAEPT